MKRRQFCKLAAAAVGFPSLVFGGSDRPDLAGRARTPRRLLPADTDLGSLLFENPAGLDPRNLPLTPIGDFQTMGLSEHRVNTGDWRLRIGGSVARPAGIDYRRIRQMPSVTRDVLLICPGTFAFYARWRGVSLGSLLELAGVDPNAGWVDVKGPAGPYRKVERFSMEAVRADEVFLAYAVNGRPLPVKHGFPLRAVAEGRVGSEWVKYVDGVEAVVAEAPGDPGSRAPAPPFVP